MSETRVTIIESSATPTTKVEWLSLRALEPNPFQPRELFDEAELHELAASIKEDGVLQPILARPHPRKKGGFQIVSGERRWRASAIAQQKLIPCIVKQLGDRKTQELALLENLQRASLTDYEEAAGIRNLWKALEEEGEEVTIRGMARRIKKSQSFVRDRMNLLKMRPEIVEMTRRKMQVMSSAELINKVSDRGRRLEYIRLVDEGASFRDLKSRVQKDDEIEKLKQESRAPDDYSRRMSAQRTAREREAQKEVASALQDVETGVRQVIAWWGHLSEDDRRSFLTRLNPAAIKLADLQTISR